MSRSADARLEGGPIADRCWINPDGVRWRYPDDDEHAASIIAKTLDLSLPAFDAAMAEASFFERVQLAEWRASLIQAVRECHQREAKAWITLMRLYLLSSERQRRWMASQLDQDEARRRGGLKTRRLPPDAQLLEAVRHAAGAHGARRGAMQLAYRAIAEQYNVTAESVRRAVQRARQAVDKADSKSSTA
ncbi:hypothetical protein [Azohydromonas sediminis]|uniref:hypothetical protein n=1 Tax=Azohydromonas sediminis TaxID=2259674 RepID=UPI0013C36B09|nr:hypothetical protein [Azohydromonas sediminis]